MRNSTFFILLTLIAFQLSAQDMVLNVWSDEVQDDNKVVSEDYSDDGMVIRNSAKGKMYVFLPEEKINTGAAVVICPGGGYRLEAMKHEGYDIARYFQKKGVAGIVLKYRLPYGNDKVPSSDAKRAIRIVRKNAKEWGIDTDKIGIAGASAGGHLASTIGTDFDFGKESNNPVEQQSCRPDFMLLLYPVITMNKEFVHEGSRKKLLGKDNSNNPELLLKYSNELNVTEKTPPTFLVLADDDKVVSPRNSIEFYSALKQNNIPSEIHIFQKGGHGFGMKKKGGISDKWPEMFLEWLKTIKIIG